MPKGEAQEAMRALESRRRSSRTRTLVEALALLFVFVGVLIWVSVPGGAGQGLVTYLGIGDAGVGELVLLVLGVLAVSLLMGLQDRVIAKIGLRNVGRAKTRTAILLVGLLVGSTIISSSLVIGDTVNTLSVHFAYVADGAVDEAVFASPSVSLGGQSVLTYAPIPAPLFAEFNQSASAIPGVAGVTPMLIGEAGAFDLTRDVAQPGIKLIGVNASADNLLGDFTSTGGSTVIGPLPGEALLNPTAATELSAQPGDLLNLSAGQGVTLSMKVQAVVKEDTRGGFQDAGEGDIFLTLPNAQNLTGAPDTVDYVAITNVGGLTGGPSHRDQVWGPLNTSFFAAGRSPWGPWPSGATVVSVLPSDLASAAEEAQSLTQLFLVLGLFSIGAGCVLIVGIFAMLAEERRGEMGVARAIGMRRGQLIRAYYFEGMAYSAGAALLGTLLGVVVGWGIIQLFAQLFGAAGNTATQAITASFTFTDQSLILAYTAGFLLTLVTVTFTCAYVSRMNIVRAIRSQPELVNRARSRLWLASAGVLLALVGAGLFVSGHRTGTDIDIGYLGASMLILAAGLLAATLVEYRWAFSGAALVLLVFWGSNDLRNDLFPGSHTGTIFVFFQEGVFLILAAVILYVFNSSLIVRLFARLSRGSARNLPVVRLAFSYPSQRRFRSAMTISIFAMVLFTITAIAAIGSGISTGVGNTVQSESGGYTFVGLSTSPIQNFTQEVGANAKLHSEVSAAIPFAIGGAVVSLPNGGGSFPYSMVATPVPPASGSVPAWQNFYSTNRFNFSSTLDGLSASAVWTALQAPNSTYIVLDGSFAQSSFGSAFGGGSSHPPAQVGDNLTFSGTFGAPVTLRVLGILSQSTIPAIIVNPELMAYTFNFTQQEFFLLTAAPGVDPTTVSQTYQTFFFSHDLELINLGAVLATALQFTNAFIDLLEVFVALGLVVGITALGILALRAVVERRTQVGVVRAIGFRRSQVLAAFLTEYSFLALMGIGIGAVMGLVLAYNLYEAVGGFFSFSIPWVNLALVLGASYALTLLATGFPSFRASRIPPAEAIRYTE